MFKASIINRPLILRLYPLVISVTKYINKTAEVKKIVAYAPSDEGCMACSVVVTVNDVVELLIQKLKEKTYEIKIGSGLDKNVFVDSVIRGEHK